MTDDADHPREESGVHRLAALLRADATRAVEPEHDEAEWRMLLRAAQADDVRGLHRSRPLRWWWIAPVAACAALAVAWGLHHEAARSSLCFDVDGRPSSSGPIATENQIPRTVAFSDGSTVVLRPSARLRVTATHADGASLLLERGPVDVSVRHRPASRWRLDAGPYVVEVTGTRFNVAWDPDAGELGVSLLDGIVHISGPGISSPMPLQAGQQFHGNQVGSYAVDRGPEHMLAPVAAANAPTARGAVAPATKVTRLASAAGADLGASPAAQTKPSCDFTELVSRARFEAAVSRAQRQGVEITLAECPIRSLFALADAARYVAQFELSKNALLAIRKRAPDERGKAAFFLGRLEEARGNLDLASTWYGEAVQGKGDAQFAREANAANARIAKRHRVASPPSHDPP
jgi:ferric-dicitrate binding protein FerR (iron transport regulator)